MRFNKHSDYEGKHAFLSPSAHSWLRYSDEKLYERFHTWQAASRGTELHEFAKNAITLGISMPRTHKTLNMYINDAIGYGLKPEVILYYSDNCFGTADAIGFNMAKRLLRISDLKTGVTPAHMEQLIIYAAIFFLEYGARLGVTPEDCKTELRIYQLDDVIFLSAPPETIRLAMNQIIHSDAVIESIKSEEGIE